MPCWREEIFGPVAAFRKFSTEAEALQEANSSDKGLAAFFFSR
jgi:succinate-semialdehyde dehydrogenase/glutarate-semialdehyde dehydrogenase